MSTGAIRMREYRIHPALRPHVKCLWSLESPGPLHDAGRERILPDSCVELVFHFQDPYRSHFPNGESALQPRSFVVGQMRRVLEIIESSRGQVRVNDLAAEIGVSCRHLTRQFERAVGLSPKEFGRISRFLHALQLLTAGSRRSLTDVALDCGFFDQAHFNHEFRDLAGMSPGDLSTFPNVSF
jgi:AraC-like DNA-binding protein